MATIVKERTATPWHLWAVAIISLVWFAGGAYDYVMTKTLDMDYLGMAADNVGVPIEVVIDYFGSYPLWANICWAFGVWGAVAGSILLLIRSRFAVHALAASVLGLMGSTIYAFTSDMPPEFASPFQLVFSLAIWLSVLALAVYAKAMAVRGVLH